MSTPLPTAPSLCDKPPPPLIAPRDKPQPPWSVLPDATKPSPSLVGVAQVALSAQTHVPSTAVATPTPNIDSSSRRLAAQRLRCIAAAATAAEPFAWHNEAAAVALRH